jgi:aldehyde dehydrogenase (NAD+)
MLDDIFKDLHVSNEIKNYLSQDDKNSFSVHSPVDGLLLASLRKYSLEDTQKIIDQAHQAFLLWRSVPAPKRGELVRLWGDELRAYKEPLAKLVTLECGKILSEGRGEVQEMIDICDFAVGLSRQLYGLTIASERPSHHMREVWHPLGAVAVITAFNFPVAVWAWNAALAFVCGDSVIWKPSEKTPLTCIAAHELFLRALKKYNQHADEKSKASMHLNQIALGFSDVGQALAQSPKIPLVSATGSTYMGRSVAQTVVARLGRSLLELGGNNAMIISAEADLDMAVRAILFGAVGTAGQRCTTLRRLIVHKSVYEDLKSRLVKAYQSLRIGSPFDPSSLIGPLIDQNAFDKMQSALLQAQKQGGTVLEGGQRRVVANCEKGFYVTPALVEMPTQSEIVQHETFAPILYMMRYDHLTQAIDLQNNVPQGLSSSLFTLNMREAEYFLSASGSDCGIANINIGTSGAEIGGAFGGEKDTGGGRESGSDSWKNYMRRQTQTINYSAEIPLAQGVVFDV